MPLVNPVIAGTKTKTVHVTRDISTGAGTQDITGFGFTPTSLMIVISNGGARAQFALYLVDSAASVQGFANDNTAVNGAYQGSVTIGPGVVAGTGFARATLSYIADGFRLTWAANTGTPTGTVDIMVLGRN